MIVPCTVYDRSEYKLYSSLTSSTAGIPQAFCLALMGLCLLIATGTQFGFGIETGFLALIKEGHP